MEDQTEVKPDVAEHRKPLRKSYKGIAVTWKRLFIGVSCLALILAYMLCMALRGNTTLQREANNHLTDTK